MSEFQLPLSHRLQTSKTPTKFTLPACTNEFLNIDMPRPNRADSFNQPRRQAPRLDSGQWKNAGSNPAYADLSIPTFGNWKKQDLFQNLENDTQIKRKLTNFPMAQISDRNTSRGRHPKIAKNCKFLAKFYSEEIEAQVRTRILPKISKTCSMKVDKSDSHRKVDIPYDSLKIVEDCSSESTKQSIELATSEVHDLKTEFMRIYLAQKQKYESVLHKNNVVAQLNDQEFTNFIAKMNI